MAPRSNDELLAAVAEPSRRRLLDLMLAEGESTPSSLATQMPVTRQAVSKHLAVLDRAGLVTSRRTGREVKYVINEDRLDQASREMQKVAAGWEKRLQKIKQLAEAAENAKR